jgi:hypothetical protein
MTRATVDGLKRLVRPEDVALLRGKTIAEVLPVSARRNEPQAPAEEAPLPKTAEEAAE